jgi:tRNA(Ile)-lysidine synthase TilS/MesJ
MNKYKLKMKTPTGLGNEYVYVYATSNFERYLNKHNLKYARDITKDYQLTDRFEKLQQTVNQLEEENKELKSSMDNAINVLKENSFGISYMEVSELLKILEKGKE